MSLPILAGLLAGFVHVLAGPDHLAAVAPLVADGRRRSWRTGLFWGLGHTGGVWLVAAAALLLRGLLPVEAMSSWSERLVGVVLIGIGLWGLRRAMGDKVHVHEHTHDGEPHEHIHIHAEESSHAHTHAAVGVGILHGLAGTAHLLGVLPALALPTLGSAIVYVIAFGAGSIAAMTGFAWLIGQLFGRLTGSTRTAYRWFLGGCSAAAIAVGVLWIVQSAATGA